MEFWIVKRNFVLAVVAATSAEEAIETIIETRNQEYWYGLMDEEDKAGERRELVATKLVLPDKPTVLAEYRE